MRMLPTILATLALCVTPAAATRDALADVQSLAPEHRGQMRYVICETPEQQIAVNYVLNAVSRGGTMVKTVGVGVQGSGDRESSGAQVPDSRALLLRIDLATLANQRDPRTYHEVHAAWERLAEFDPYFHVRTLLAAPLAERFAVAGPAARLQEATQQSPHPRSASQATRLTTVTVDGGWVGLENATRLRALTGSAGAVLRADYFVTRASAEDYYAWAGIQAKQTDFFKALGVDKSVIEKLAADNAANLFRSQVTFKPRRVVRLPGPQGSVWITLDVDGESPDRDPVRNPVDVAGPAGTQRFNFQASEIFYARANGFWGVALFDAKGDRQATVPDKVAKDTEDQEGIVRPLISCIRCHEAHGKAGLQPFTDDQYALLSGEAGILRSYLPEVAQRVAELYNPARLNKALDRDRADYAEAVERACGCTTAEAATALTVTFARYVEDEVSRETAAREAGVPVEILISATAASTDPITLALRAGKRVTRKAFEASYQDIMLRVTK